MTPTDTRREIQFCSVLARQKGLAPAGSGGAAYDHILVLETPLPWPAKLFAEPGTMPPEVLTLVRQQTLQRSPGSPRRFRPLAMAPDPEYTQVGYRRLLYYQRPTTPFAVFTPHEFLVPESQVGALAWALLQEPETLSRFEPYRQDSSSRDLLVCTHGTMDAACARFGSALYQTLRQQYAALSDGSLRVWRVSHVGGHVFAPTLLDLPAGRSWAHLDDDVAELVVRCQGDITRLRGHYRGWIGLEPPFLQVAEGAILMRAGWAWLDYHKHGTVVAQDPMGQPNTRGQSEPTWAEVQIAFAAPDNSVQGIYSARVEIRQHIATPATSRQAELHAYPQYMVTRLEKISPFSE